MPNDKPNKIPMTFEYMQTLVRSFLERPCSCQSKDGNSCPTDDSGNIMWHTWRRYGANGQLCEHDASCFVKRDRLSLNIADIESTIFLQEMKTAGWTIELNDCRYANMTRYDVMAMEATTEELTVLKRWVKNTVKAFPSRRK